MGEISAASAEQSAGVAQVGEAVTQMDQATQQNAALVEESAAAAESLKQQAQQLVQAVAVFKVGPTDDRLRGAGGTGARQRRRPSPAAPSGVARAGAKNVMRPNFGARPRRVQRRAPVAAPAGTGTDDWESF